MRRIILLLIATFILTVNLSAKIYYVSTSGNNSNSGLSPTAAWKTVTYAAGSSSPIVAGDTVYIQAGNYGAENVVFKKSGTAAKPIAFLGYKSKPGDAPPLLINNSDSYAAFSTSNMPTFDGGDRSSKGIAFNCRDQRFLIIKNLQIRNYGYGIIGGSSTQKDDSRLILYNINVSTIGSTSDSFAGFGILLGMMGTEFANNCNIENCLVVNVAAEGMDICGDNNVLRGCKVYCNDKAGSAPTDYYILITGSYNKLYNCYIERLPKLSHSGHGISIKDNAEQVVDKSLGLPVIKCEYNEIYDCISRNMGESFCVRHRRSQYNLFSHCKAYGTHTGVKDSSPNEGDCIVTRDGASNNIFDGCIGENCAAGLNFEDTIEDGDYASNPPGHPGNGNMYINCLFINCYYGIQFDDYSIPSDAGSNTVANCTFYKTRYMFYAGRKCANMKYINNIYYGSLPNKVGGYFKGGPYASDIVMNGSNSYFKNCDFYNIEGSMPSDFTTNNSVGNIFKDPLFKDPTQDLQLSAASPCIDAGITMPDVKTDFIMTTRPQGKGYDMGAYENRASTSSLSLSVTTADVKCNGGSDGSAIANVSGGKSPYIYAWSNGKSTSSISGLKPGDYSVSVTDANNSTKSVSLTITQPDAFNIIFSNIKNVSCNGGSNGQITAKIDGGTPPFNYSWSKTPNQNSPTVTGLKVGSYSVLVTDNNGCTKNSSSTTITQPTVLSETITATTNVNCKDGNNGSLTAGANGGVSPYSFLWKTSPSQAAAVATGLSAGTYTCVVTDANNCSSSMSSSVKSNNSFTVSLTSTTQVKCNGGNDGFATVNASGGVAPYTYNWSTSPIQKTPTATGLRAGSYTVNANGSAGCSQQMIINITEPSAIVLTMSSTDVQTNGGSDGTAIVAVSGGTKSYTYSWSTSPVQKAATATGLSAGTYSVIVFDANGCSKMESVTITEPLQFFANISSSSNIHCNGGSDGSATVSASGGTKPYTYNWTTSPIQKSATATGLNADTYSVTITDAGGSSKIISVIITEPAILAASILNTTNVQTTGGSDGSATAGASGGTQPYSYSWNTSLVQNTANATGLKAGKYSVMVTDAFGCTQSTSVEITEPANTFTIKISNHANVHCNGGSDGFVAVTTTGGTQPYTYSWNTSPVQKAATATGLKAGKYTVTVTDATGNSQTANIKITEPDAYCVGIMSFANVSCYGGNNGAATVEGMGGGDPYTYTWNTVPVQTGPIATGLRAGAYYVTAVDVAGCSSTSKVTIKQPDKIVTKVTVKDYQVSSSSAIVDVTGGEAPYKYLWSTQPAVTTPEVFGLFPGIYYVDITDNNACRARDSAIVKGNTTDVADVDGGSDFSIYPNPSVNRFFVKSPDKGGADKSVLVVLYDNNGQEVYSKVIMRGESIAIDTENKIAPGIYMVVASSNDYLYKRKLIIER